MIGAEGIDIDGLEIGMLLHKPNQLLAKFGFTRSPTTVDNHRRKVDGRCQQPDDVLGYRLTVKFIMCSKSFF